MDDLCTACLCSGRNLYFIGETGFYNLYSQILNEIQAYENVCVRVCWECRALLARFQQFKTQVQRSYGELMMHLHQNTPKHTVYKAPRLSIQQMAPVSCSELQIKSELECELDLMPIDHIKTETVDVEHSEDTFVNGLEVEQKYDVKKTNKKKAKKKLRVYKNKKKLKALNDAADGFSDREPIGDNVPVDDSVQDVDDNVQGADDIQVSENKVEGNCLICAKCGLLFDEKAAFDGHVQKEHNSHIKVNIENKDAPIKVTRVKRIETLAEKPQCTECGKVFSSRKTYRYHLNVLHKGQNRYPCPRCGKVYQWKSNLGRHLRTHKARDDGELYCELCDKRFASVATYRQHLRVSRRHVSESEFSFVCNECGKKFVNKTRLRDHVDWEHLKKIKYKCQLCNKPFKCHTSLYVHMQNVHKNKEKKDNLCHVCGKSYQNAAKLKYHIVAMHTSETPYQCGQCAAAFGWYSSLYRHIREVHYKMKVQPKKPKKGKKPNDAPAMPLALPQPGPP